MREAAAPRREARAACTAWSRAASCDADQRLPPGARARPSRRAGSWCWPALLVAGSSFFLFTTLKSELAPIEDRGTIVGIGIAPEGSTLEFTDRYAKQIEQLYEQVPEIEQYFVVTGFPVVSQVISFSRLEDWEERERGQQEVVAELAPQMFGVPGHPGLCRPTRPRSARARSRSRCSS